MLEAWPQGAAAPPTRKGVRRDQRNVLVRGEAGGSWTMMLGKVSRVEALKHPPTLAHTFTACTHHHTYAHPISLYLAFVRTQYKTVGSHGVDVTPLDAFDCATRLLAPWLDRFRQAIVKKDNDHAFVFVGARGRPFACGAFSVYLGKLVQALTGHRMACVRERERERERERGGKRITWHLTHARSSTSRTRRTCCAARSSPISTGHAMGATPGCSIRWRRLGRAWGGERKEPHLHTHTHTHTHTHISSARPPPQVMRHSVKEAQRTYDRRSALERKRPGLRYLADQARQAVVGGGEEQEEQEEDDPDAPVPPCSVGDVVAFAATGGGPGFGLGRVVAVKEGSRGENTVLHVVSPLFRPPLRALASGCSAVSPTLFAPTLPLQAVWEARGSADGAAGRRWTQRLGPAVTMPARVAVPHVDAPWDEEGGGYRLRTPECVLCEAVAARLAEDV